MDSVSSGQGPTNAELVELLEKQDAMLDSLHNELDRTRIEIKRMIEEEEYRKESEQITSNVISEAEKKVNTALSTVEILHNHNEKLQEEIINMRKRLDEERPIAALITMKEENKKMNQLLNDAKQSNVGLQNDKEELQLELKQLKEDLSSQRSRHDSATAALMDRLNAANHQQSATKFKLDSVEADREHSSVRLEGQLEILSQKERQMEELCSQMNTEMNTLRKEKNALSGRVSALSQENSSLRNKVLQRTPQKEGGTEDEQLRKLMSDQSHLIAALREETKILTERMEEERKEFKNRLRESRRENKELQERLDKVLRI